MAWRKGALEIVMIPLKGSLRSKIKNGSGR
jgi:hypothetical protein